MLRRTITLAAASGLKEVSAMLHLAYLPAMAAMPSPPRSGHLDEVGSGLMKGR